jgi:hypothetical protein
MGYGIYLRDIPLKWPELAAAAFFGILLAVIILIFYIGHMGFHF